MSRGPGKIERAVERAFTSNLSGTFSVDELAALCYPDINRPEKRHRVAILRAADNVASRLGWFGMRAERPGHPMIYRNALDVRSYTLGILRCDFVAGAQPLAALEQRVDDLNAYRSECADMQPGGAWWLHVEINRAEYESRAEDAAAAPADLERYVGEKFAKRRPAASS